MKSLEADSAEIACMQGNQKASATKILGASPAEKDQLQVCDYGKRKSLAPEPRGP